MTYFDLVGSTGSKTLCMPGHGESKGSSPWFNKIFFFHLDAARRCSRAPTIFYLHTKLEYFGFLHHLMISRSTNLFCWVYSYTCGARTLLAFCIPCKRPINNLRPDALFLLLNSAPDDAGMKGCYIQMLILVGVPFCNAAALQHCKSALNSARPTMSYIPL